MLENVWDVFISHAYEDKEEIARPLANKLAEAGLKVWLDEAELMLGDSLREKIDEGLTNSQFGVIILSRPFFDKRWPKSELNGLFAKASAVRYFNRNLISPAYGWWLDIGIDRSNDSQGQSSSLYDQKTKNEAFIINSTCSFDMLWV